jgi:hypothetical protein
MPAGFRAHRMRIVLQSCALPTPGGAPTSTPSMAWLDPLHSSSASGGGVPADCDGGACCGRDGSGSGSDGLISGTGSVSIEAHRAVVLPRLEKLLTSLKHWRLTHKLRVRYSHEDPRAGASPTVIPFPAAPKPH